MTSIEIRPSINDVLVPQLFYLAQIEPSPSIDTVQQPLPEHLFIPIDRQLQQIYTRARAR